MPLLQLSFWARLLARAPASDAAAVRVVTCFNAGNRLDLALPVALVRRRIFPGRSGPEMMRRFN